MQNVEIARRLEEVAELLQIQLIRSACRLIGAPRAAFAI
jgi:hypothetical protein